MSVNLTFENFESIKSKGKKRRAGSSSKQSPSYGSTTLPTLNRYSMGQIDDAAQTLNFVTASRRQLGKVIEQTQPMARRFLDENLGEDPKSMVNIARTHRNMTSEKPSAHTIGFKSQLQLNLNQNSEAGLPSVSNLQFTSPKNLIGNFVTGKDSLKLSTTSRNFIVSPSVKTSLISAKNSYSPQSQQMPPNLFARELKNLENWVDQKEIDIKTLLDKETNFEKMQKRTKELEKSYLEGMKKVMNAMPHPDGPLASILRRLSKGLDQCFDFDQGNYLRNVQKLEKTVENLTESKNNLQKMFDDFKQSESVEAYFQKLVSLKDPTNQKSLEELRQDLIMRVDLFLADTSIDSMAFEELFRNSQLEPSGAETLLQQLNQVLRTQELPNVPPNIMVMPDFEKQKERIFNRIKIVLNDEANQVKNLTEGHVKRQIQLNSGVPTYTRGTQSRTFGEQVEEILEELTELERTTGLKIESLTESNEGMQKALDDLVKRNMALNTVNTLYKNKLQDDTYEKMQDKMNSKMEQIIQSQFGDNARQMLTMYRSEIKMLKMQSTSFTKDIEAQEQSINTQADHGFFRSKVKTAVEMEPESDSMDEDHTGLKTKKKPKRVANTSATKHIKNNKSKTGASQKEKESVEAAIRNGSNDYSMDRFKVKSKVKTSLRMPGEELEDMSHESELSDSTKGPAMPRRSTLDSSKAGVKQGSPMKNLRESGSNKALRQSANSTVKVKKKKQPVARSASKTKAEVKASGKKPTKVKAGKKVTIKIATTDLVSDDSDQKSPEMTVQSPLEGPNSRLSDLVSPDLASPLPKKKSSSTKKQVQRTASHSPVKSSLKPKSLTKVPAQTSAYEVVEKNEEQMVDQIKEMTKLNMKFDSPEVKSLLDKTAEMGSFIKNFKDTQGQLDTIMELAGSGKLAEVTGELQKAANDIQNSSDMGKALETAEKLKQVLNLPKIIENAAKFLQEYEQEVKDPAKKKELHSKLVQELAQIEIGKKIMAKMPGQEEIALTEKMVGKIQALENQIERMETTRQIIDEEIKDTSAADKIKGFIQNFSTTRAAAKKFTNLIKKTEGQEQEQSQAIAAMASIGKAAEQMPSIEKLSKEVQNIVKVSEQKIEQKKVEKEEKGEEFVYTLETDQSLKNLDPPSTSTPVKSKSNTKFEQRKASEVPSRGGGGKSPNAWSNSNHSQGKEDEDLVAELGQKNPIDKVKQRSRVRKPVERGLTVESSLQEKDVSYYYESGESESPAYIKKHSTIHGSKVKRRRTKEKEYGNQPSNVLSDEEDEEEGAPEKPYLDVPQMSNRKRQKRISKSKSDYVDDVSSRLSGCHCNCHEHKHEEKEKKHRSQSRTRDENVPSDSKIQVAALQNSASQKGLDPQNNQSMNQIQMLHVGSNASLLSSRSNSDPRKERVAAYSKRKSAERVVVHKTPFQQQQQKQLKKQLSGRAAAPVPEIWAYSGRNSPEEEHASTVDDGTPKQIQTESPRKTHVVPGVPIQEAPKRHPSKQMVKIDKVPQFENSREVRDSQGLETTYRRTESEFNISPQKDKSYIEIVDGKPVINPVDHPHHRTTKVPGPGQNAGDTELTQLQSIEHSSEGHFERDPKEYERFRNERLNQMTTNAAIGVGTLRSTIHNQSHKSLNSPAAFNPNDFFVKPKVPKGHVLMLPATTQTENRSFLKRLLNMINKALLSQIEQEAQFMPPAQFERTMNRFEAALPQVLKELQHVGEDYFLNEPPETEESPSPHKSRRETDGSPSLSPSPHKHKQPKFLQLTDYSRYGTHTLEVTKEIKQRVTVKQMGRIGGGFLGTARK